jgi:hypothetical protein
MGLLHPPVGGGGLDHRGDVRALAEGLDGDAGNRGDDPVGRRGRIRHDGAPAGRGHARVQMGGAPAAVEAFRNAPTPNVIIVEIGAAKQNRSEIAAITATGSIGAIRYSLTPRRMNSR